MAHWGILLLAILTETFATSMLKSSEGFTRLFPSIGVGVGYGISFYCLALTLKVLPIGLTYAIWSGLGIVLISLIGWVVYQQKLDFAAILGMVLIVCGVLVMNLFSKSMGH